jgi:hypothetical protein
VPGAHPRLETLLSILSLAATEAVVQNVDGVILAGAEWRVCAGFVGGLAGSASPTVNQITPPSAILQKRFLRESVVTKTRKWGRLRTWFIRSQYIPLASGELPPAG